MIKTLIVRAILLEGTKGEDSAVAKTKGPKKVFSEKIMSLVSITGVKHLIDFTLKPVQLDSFEILAFTMNHRIPVYFS